MKRLVLLVLFAAALVGLFAWLFVNRGTLSLAGDKHQNVRTIVPSEDNTAADTSANGADNASYDESKAQPLISLEADETFLQAIAVDINKDGEADQICAVKKNTEPNIYLIPGIKNPVSGETSRLQAIRTGVTQTRTLLFYALDIIGDRSNALICSGMTAENLQLLTVYLPVTDNEGKTSFTTVADLRSDGSINIQETARSDAYNIGLTGGDSYPIYTYNSDPDAPQTLDQIERVYRWDKALKRYEQASETRIEGKKIETKLIRQLQDADLDSFETFLGGLWNMPSTSNGEPKYLYFDPAEKEMIFHDGSTEEIYTIESGSARRYGAYLSTRNKSISSIRRLIDIELTGIDEIRIKVMEDVNLKIGVASDWDGQFRKMATNSVIPSQKKTMSAADLQAILESSGNDWVSADGQTFRVAKGEFTLTRSDGTLSGQYATLLVSDKPVIQLRTSGPAAKSRFFLAETGSATVSGRTTQTLTLTEVSVSIGGTTYMGSPPVVFTRAK